MVNLAWANIYIGIYVYHTSQWEEPYAPWIAPIAIVMVLQLVKCNCYYKRESHVEETRCTRIINFSNYIT